MLSINLPVYNIEVSSLVLQLIDQARKLKINFEIRVYDDGSIQEIKNENRKIADQSNVVYLELEKNLGRSAIRNKMGLESEFEYLLFIDADSRLVESNYLKVFLANTKPGRVLCGGTVYQKEKPADPKKLLRWYYGTRREAISAETRNSKKGFIITSNNFLIEKNVFKQIHFREDIKNYGHEDTLLGYDLFQKKIEILHINNPVEHVGLEDAKVFLEKTKQALKNLFWIQNELLKTDEVFVEQVHFLNKYTLIRKYIPRSVFSFIYFAGRKLMESNLRSKSPVLFWFDLYKIAFYSTLKQ